MARGWAVALFASLSGAFLAGGLTKVCFALSPAFNQPAPISLMPFQNERSPMVLRKDSSVIVPVFPDTAGSSDAPRSYPTFNSKQLDRQLQLYLKYLTQFGPPDILVVGSSRSLQGIDPIALQNSLAQRGYPGLKVFNFGINGATAQVVDWLLRRLLTPDQLPKLIVWADGSRAFNNGRMDQTYSKIIASEGHRRLVAGVRPGQNQTHSMELGSICLDLLPMPMLQSKSVEKDVKPTVLPADPRSHCAQPVKVVLQDIPLNFRSAPSSPETAGLQVVTTRFSPPSYFQRFPKVSGFYDADYQNFTLVGRQTEALERITTFAKTQKIPLVIVNLPLTATYLEDGRTSFEQRFRSHMRRLAASNQFWFKDLAGQPALSQDQYFADPSHLNRFGAIAVANAISQDLVAPLAQVRQSKFVPLESNPPRGQTRSERSPDPSPVQLSLASFVVALTLN